MNTSRAMDRGVQTTLLSMAVELETQGAGHMMRNPLSASLPTNQPPSVATAVILLANG